MQPETFLRRVLWLDAATCTVMAVLLLAGGGLLELILGLPRTLHIVAGLLLIPCAALMAVAASRRPRADSLVWLVILGNLSWTAASVWIALSGVVDATALGTAFLLLQAVAVLGLAGVEWMGLRRLRGIAGTA